MPSVRERVRGALESPRAPWVILLATLLVALPTIKFAFYNDDHAFRAMLLGTPGLSVGQYSVSVVISGVLCIAGVLLFQRTARTFIDYA
jgi:hypothetical protein